MCFNQKSIKWTIKSWTFRSSCSYVEVWCIIMTSSNVYFLICHSSQHFSFTFTLTALLLFSPKVIFSYELTITPSLSMHGASLHWQWTCRAHLAKKNKNMSYLLPAAALYICMASSWVTSSPPPPFSHHWSHWSHRDAWWGQRR